LQFVFSGLIGLSAKLLYNAFWGIQYDSMMMFVILYSVGGILLLYVLFTLFLTYLVQQIPRNPVEDKPDWGQTIDIGSKNRLVYTGIQPGQGAPL